MKLTSEKKYKLTLILDEEEARWLQSMVQNPITHYHNPDKETEEDKKMRKRFWEVLSGV